jgi:hypothetical protein
MKAVVPGAMHVVQMHNGGVDFFIGVSNNSGVFKKAHSHSVPRNVP